MYAIQKAFCKMCLIMSVKYRMLIECLCHGIFVTRNCIFFFLHVRDRALKISFPYCPLDKLQTPSLGCYYNLDRMSVWAFFVS